MTLPEILEIVRYNCWANRQVFGASVGLTLEQQETYVASSFASIRETLAHVVGAEWYWLHIWIGDIATANSPLNRHPSVMELQTQLSAIESQRETLLEAYQQEDLEKIVPYRDSEGEFSVRLERSICHMVNHSTYHRGQTTTQFRQLGLTPPNTDFTRYLRQGR